MKLAVVVQRYGLAVNGGAELHARYVAEHLARHGEVEVLTTCATDYVTWRNDAPAGEDRVNGLLVRRFPVAHERDPMDFATRSTHVFTHRHSIADELSWLESEGPSSPALIRHLRATASAYDFCLFFSYRYHQSFHGIRTAAERAVLVPTAERDSAIGLGIFPPVFRGVRALMYNSPEEQAMIQAVSGNHGVPGVVVGVGSEIARNPQPNRFRQKHGVRGPFAIYIGRIDENKGCGELFTFFEEYLREAPGDLSLVLVGKTLLPVPEHPRIKHLGFLDDTDKFDALAAADLLIMPSYFESLSMVTLEAWALAKPVLVNAKCDVLKAQCVRSGGGLYYDGRAEFLGALGTLERNKWVAASLGRNGRRYYREHYDWAVVERKYLDMLNRLKAQPPSHTMERMPGWLSRRRADQRAAADIVAALPRGSAEPARTPAQGRQAS